MPSQSKLQLKHIDRKISYSFSFERCDSVFEWTEGSINVIEYENKDDLSIKKFITIEGSFFGDSLKTVVNFIKKMKEETEECPL